jgi:hypothetical protein
MGPDLEQQEQTMISKDHASVARLVIFPSALSDDWGWQYTELWYRRGYAEVRGAERGALLAPDLDPHQPLHLREALLAAARQLRSDY